MENRSFVNILHTYVSSFSHGVYFQVCTIRSFLFFLFSFLWLTLKLAGALKICRSYVQDAPKIAKRMTVNIVVNCVALHWTVFVKLKKWLVFIPIFCDILNLRVEDSQVRKKTLAMKLTWRLMKRPLSNIILNVVLVMKKSFIFLLSVMTMG